MGYEEIKKKYNLTDEKVGEIFGYKNKMSFYNATRKKLIIEAVVKLHELFTEK